MEDTDELSEEVREWRAGILKYAAYTMASFMLFSHFDKTAPDQDHGCHPDLNNQTHSAPGHFPPRIKPEFKNANSNSQTTPSVQAIIDEYGDKMLYNAPPHITHAIHEATKDDPVISFPTLFNLIGSESGFREDATSPTGVKGLNQMVLPTLLEQAWKSQNLLPDKQRQIALANIEPFEEKKGDDLYIKYRIKNGGSEKAVRSISNDHTSALILAREYLKEIAITGHNNFKNALTTEIKELEQNGRASRKLVRYLKKERERDPTTVDLKAYYTFGPNMGYNLPHAKAHPGKQGNKAILHMTGPSGRHNSPLLFAGNGMHKTPIKIEHLWNHFADKVGNEVIPDGTPQMAKATEQPKKLAGLER